MIFWTIVPSMSSNSPLKRKASFTSARLPADIAAAAFNRRVGDIMSLHEQVLDIMDSSAIARTVYRACMHIDARLVPFEEDFVDATTEHPEMCDAVVALRVQNGWNKSNWAGLFQIGLSSSP